MRIDRLFRKSGLMRKKWERADYRANTIKEAIEKCTKVYIPSRSGKSSPDKGNNTCRFFTAKGKFQHNLFVDFILSKYEFVKIENNLHVYVDGLYVRVDEETISKIAIDFIPELTIYQRKEVYEYVKIKYYKERTLSPPNLIPFNSKVYDLNKDKFHDYNYDYVFINKIPFDYNVNVACQPSIDAFMRKITDGNEDIINLIYEFVGYCFYRRCMYRKLAVFLGSGGNGKSSLLNLIEKLPGAYNTSGLSLQDLADKFRVGELYGKLVNLGDDISANYIPDASLLRNITSGGKITAERKFKDPFNFFNVAKMLFAANELPKVNDKTKAFISRLLIIPLNHDFINDPDYDPHLKDKEWSKAEIEYFLKLAVEGLKRLLKQNNFTKPMAVLNEINEYEKYNNPVKAFIDEYGSMERKLTDNVYAAYSKWCSNNNRSAQSKTEFSKVVHNLTGLKSVNSGKRINNKQKRHYAKQ